MLTPEPLANKLLRKGFWTYLLSILVAPTGYFIRVIVSNDLPIDEVGLIYGVISFILLISIYNDLGLTESLQYFLPKYRIEKAYDKYTTLTISTFVMQFFSGACIGAALRWGAPRLAEHYFHSPKVIPVLHVFVLYFFAINIFQMMSTFYNAFQDIIREKIIDVLRLYTVFGGTYVLWIMNELTLTSFAKIWFIGLCVGLAVSLCYFVWAYGATLTKGKFHLLKSDVHRWFSYAFRVFLGVNAAMLFLQLDMQMAIAFLGPESAGYYTNYLSIYNIYLIAIGPILSLVFPLTTQLITEKQIDKLMMFMHMLYKYFSVGALLLGGIFIAFGPDIAGFLFGEQYVFSGLIASYTGVFIAFPLLQLFNYGILAGMGKVKERMLIISLGLLLTAACNYIFLMTTSRGVYSIVCGTVLGQFFTMAMSTYYITRTYRFGYNRWFVLKNAVVIAAFTAVSFYTKTLLFLPLDGITHSRIWNSMIIGMYCCIHVLMLAFLNKSELLLLRKETKKYHLSKQTVTDTTHTEIV